MPLPPTEFAAAVPFTIVTTKGLAALGLIMLLKAALIATEPIPTTGLLSWMRPTSATGTDAVQVAVVHADPLQLKA
jgi:hypothetical protein